MIFIGDFITINLLCSNHKEDIQMIYDQMTIADSVEEVGQTIIFSALLLLCRDKLIRVN